MNFLQIIKHSNIKYIQMNIYTFHIYLYSVEGKNMLNLMRGKQFFLSNFSYRSSNFQLKNFRCNLLKKQDYAFVFSYQLSRHFYYQIP